MYDWLNKSTSYRSKQAYLWQTGGTVGLKFPQHQYKHLKTTLILVRSSRSPDPSIMELHWDFHCYTSGSRTTSSVWRSCLNSMFERLKMHLKCSKKIIKTMLMWGTKRPQRTKRPYRNTVYTGCLPVGKLIQKPTNVCTYDVTTDMW